MHKEIKDIAGDALINIVLDTIGRGKQIIIFVNTKRGAEATAEKISLKLKNQLDSNELTEISEKLQKAVSSPTRQCLRLGKIAAHGSVFHHAGLHSKQRDLIEEKFREGIIKVICATPTLAMGIDLPAFRVIIRDLKRYGGHWGMSDIPVLEYEQQAGRAGRPSYDKEGEAICIASSTQEKEKIWHQYIMGEPEEILSKLAVEPVLRTYILSLVSTGYVDSLNSLKDFMKETLYAHQYKDLSKLSMILLKMVKKLEDWEFISTPRKSGDGFVSASEFKNDDFKIEATKLGQRVAELYLDPLTAHYLLVGMQKAASMEQIDYFSVLQMISWTLEMRPLLRARKIDYEAINAKLVLVTDSLITPVPEDFEEEFDEFLDSIKTSIVLEEWMNETSEEKLLELFNVSPGELNAKLDRGDWLLYASYELSKLQGFKEISKKILKTRIRLKSGVKEELLALLKLKGIGRVRARKLFTNGIKDLGGVKRKDVSMLAMMLGKKVALDIKKQVGQDYSEDKIIIKPRKRTGQISLEDFT